MLSSRVGDGKCSTSSPSSSEEDSCSHTTATTDASSITLDNEVIGELRPFLAPSVANSSAVPSMVHTGECSRWRMNGCGYVVGVGREELSSSTREAVSIDREEPDGCSVSSGSSCDPGACVEVKDS